MELIILKNNLVKGLASVDNTVGGSQKLPILKSVKIEASSNNKINIISTNLESATMFKTSAKVLEEGVFVVPFDVIKGLVNNLKSDKVKLIKEKEVLNIVADNYEASINCDNEDDFPMIPSIENRTKSLGVNGPALLKILKQALKATKHSEIRPEINGVYLNYQKKDGLVAVGTDSFRLFEGLFNKNDFDTNMDDFQITIPLHTAESLAKNLQDEDKIKIFIDPTQVSFETDDMSLISRIVDGDFPDYKSFMPKDSKRRLIVDRDELINAVKVSRTFSGKANDIVFNVVEKGKVLEVKSSNNTLGKNTYRLPVKIKGEKSSTTITFNWRYILDGLSIFDGDEVEIEVTEPEKPVVIKGNKKQKAIYVVMPIRA